MAVSIQKCRELLVSWGPGAVVEPEELRAVFARNLRRETEARGFSVGRVAELADLPPQAVHAYLHGLRTPELDELAKLAAALQCSPAVLVYPQEGDPR